MLNNSLKKEEDLNEYLKDTFYSKKKLEEDLSAWKDELVDTFDQYFERDKEYISYSRCHSLGDNIKKRWPLKDG